MLFTVLPITLSRSDLAQIDLSQAEDLSDYSIEPSAYAQFNFNKASADVLNSINNSKLLSLITNAANANRPVYNQNHLSFKSGRGTFLQSDLIDNSSLSGFTLSAVVRIPTQTFTTTNYGIMGAWNASSIGAITYLRDTNKIIAMATPSQSHREAATIVYDKFIHLNFIVDNTNKKFKVISTIEGVSSEFSFDITAARTFSDIGLILGNGFVSGSTYMTADYSEFLLFNKALSGTEISQIYSRAKKRSADKGIVI